MDTTLVAPPAPRRKRRSGLGLYQDRRGRWVLDLVIKGRRFVRRYGAVPYQVARDLAKADATAYRVEVLTGVSATPKVTDLTVTAALRRFEVERFGTLKPSTRALYRRLMRPLTAHLGATRLSALCALDLERYKRDRTAATPGRRGTGQTICNRELELLRTVVTACRTWGLTTRADNPVAAVKRFKEPKGPDRVLTDAEEDALLAALPEPDRTVVQLAIECGARAWSQLLPLTWADVDLDRAQLRLRAAHAKNGKELWVPLSSTPRVGMVARLREMQARSTSPFVFPAPLGGKLHHFRKHFSQAVRVAGLAGTGVKIHCLRHTWASRFNEATGDLLLLQKLGAWSSLALVQRYAHARMERAAEGLQRMVESGEARRVERRARATRLASLPGGRP